MEKYSSFSFEFFVRNLLTILKSATGGVKRLSCSQLRPMIIVSLHGRKEKKKEKENKTDHLRHKYSFLSVSTFSLIDQDTMLIRGVKRLSCSQLRTLIIVSLEMYGEGEEKRRRAKRRSHEAIQRNLHLHRRRREKQQEREIEGNNQRLVITYSVKVPGLDTIALIHHFHHLLIHLLKNTRNANEQSRRKICQIVRQLLDIP